MKYKTKEEMKESIETLGLCALSKFSAISHLSKLHIPLEGMIAIESMIREIECGLWTLVPLGVGNDISMFENQCNHLEKKVKSFIEAGKLMRDLKG